MQPTLNFKSFPFLCTCMVPEFSSMLQKCCTTTANFFTIAWQKFLCNKQHVTKFQLRTRVCVTLTAHVKISTNYFTYTVQTSTKLSNTINSHTVSPRYITTTTSINFNTEKANIIKYRFQIHNKKKLNPISWTIQTFINFHFIHKAAVPSKHICDDKANPIVIKRTNK